MAISFVRVDGEFVAADPVEISTSYCNRGGAVGYYQMPSVANGQYEKFHPVFNQAGSRVGYLVDAADALGYSWHCVYSGQHDKFLTLHQPCGVVMGLGARQSYISESVPTGSFWFGGKGIKFEVKRSVALPVEWVDKPLHYRLLDSGNEILYICSRGMCLIDIPGMTKRYQLDFESEVRALAVSYSPKASLVAVLFKRYGVRDVLDASPREFRSLSIYSFCDGQLMGSVEISDSEAMNPILLFSENGRQIQMRTDSEVITFDLVIS